MILDGDIITTNLSEKSWVKIAIPNLNNSFLNQCHLLISYSGLAVSLTLVYLLYNPSSIIGTVLYCCLLVLHGLWFCEVRKDYSSQCSTVFYRISIIRLLVGVEYPRKKGLYEWKNLSFISRRVWWRQYYLSKDIVIVVVLPSSDRSDFSISFSFEIWKLGYCTWSLWLMWGTMS